jgi:hypothetical protein
MAEFHDNMTIAEARDILRKLAVDGHECPLCRQYVKVYRRKLTSASARAVIALYREGRLEWMHLPTVVKQRLPDVAHQGGYMTLSGHWGLIEEERAIRRDDGGRAGFWRVTRHGERWLHRETTIPMYAHLYDSHCLRLEGEPVSILDALGTKFNWRELMGWDDD